MNQIRQNWITSAGTELPLLNLKGKEYLMVAHRIVWFREEHPDWTIESEFIERNDKYAIAKAYIKDATGRVIATGHKREDQHHFSDFIEKAETSAIGRALALCGYGTQFCADELNEVGELKQPRLADSPVEKPTIKVKESPKQAVKKYSNDELKAFKEVLTEKIFDLNAANQPIPAEMEEKLQIIKDELEIR